jgi:hypothetical protein
MLDGQHKRRIGLVYSYTIAGGNKQEHLPNLLYRADSIFGWNTTTT